MLALIGLWVWGKIDMARQRQAEYEAAEYMEQQRVAGIVQRGEAESKGLLTEVKRWRDAGEDREAVEAWAERRQREIRSGEGHRG